MLGLLGFWLACFGFGLAWIVSGQIQDAERRIIEAINGLDSSTAKQLTEKLKGPTEELDAAIKANQPKENI